MYELMKHLPVCVLEGAVNNASCSPDYANPDKLLFEKAKELSQRLNLAGAKFNKSALDDFTAFMVSKINSYFYDQAVDAFGWDPHEKTTNDKRPKFKFGKDKDPVQYIPVMSVPIEDVPKVRKDIEFAQSVLEQTKDTKENPGIKPNVSREGQDEIEKAIEGMNEQANPIKYDDLKYGDQTIGQIEEIKKRFADDETICGVATVLQSEIEKLSPKMFGADGKEISKQEHDKKHNELAEVENSIENIRNNLNNLLIQEQTEATKAQYVKERQSLDGWLKKREELSK